MQLATYNHHATLSQNYGYEIYESCSRIVTRDMAVDYRPMQFSRTKSNT